jgi:hypothetical protein
MNLVRILLLALLLFPAIAVFAQQSDPSDIGYIRIRLNDLTTSAQGQIVDDFIRSKPGVLMSRTDHNTDIFFAHYSISSGLTEADFVAWIHSVGFFTGCVVSGVRNNELPKDFPRDCGTVTEANQEHSK